MGYAMTVEKVRNLTRDILEARDTVTGGSSTYLKAVVASTQKELGSPERLRAGKAGSLDAAGIISQLAALQLVHERFYAVVIEVCSENLPAGEEKAVELNRRSNFARTAVSAIRGWIRAGNDLRPVAAARATKNGFVVEAKATRAPTPKSLNRRVERGLTELIEGTGALAKADKKAAVEQLEVAMTKLVTQLSALIGHAPTRDVAKATEDRVPFQSKSGAVFYPVMSQVAS